MTHHLKIKFLKNKFEKSSISLPPNSRGHLDPRDNRRLAAETVVVPRLCYFVSALFFGWLGVVVWVAHPFCVLSCCNSPFPLPIFEKEKKRKKCLIIKNKNGFKAIAFFSMVDT
jgi:hypothetical protein